MERVDFRSVSAPCVSFSEGECPPYIYIFERGRMLIVVMGVAYPSSLCARPLLRTMGRRSSDHHRRSKR